MVHNSRPLRRQQLVARRREHTLVKHSTLALAQMLACLPPLQPINPPPQLQAHSDTQANKPSSLPTLCHSSQHTDRLDMQTRRRNSNRHMASLRTASLATTLLSLDTPNNPHLVLFSRAFKV